MSAEEKRAEIAGCRAALPAVLEPLWQTMAHAPDQALHDASDSLRGAIPDDTERLRAVFAWLGHGRGDCMVCWMFVGRLPYLVSGWVERLGPALEGAPPEVWTGACRFLATRLQPRHALPCGVSREALSLLLTEVGGLEEGLLTALRAHWVSLGEPAAGFAFG